MIQGNIMKWTREISKQVTRLYLINTQMTTEVETEILKVAPDYPQKYFQSWFKHTHDYTNGVQYTDKGPGTDYVLGFLDTVKELGLDINLCIQATEKWQPNIKRTKAIQEWLSQNT